jgi:hypothetical protein
MEDGGWRMEDGGWDGKAAVCILRRDQGGIREGPGRVPQTYMQHMHRMETNLGHGDNLARFFTHFWRQIGF